MLKVFIDGSSGTTGLRIRERLAVRSDIEIVGVPYEKRHDEAVRRDAMAEADITFLCLPDDAAREAVKIADSLDREGKKTRIIDASTAHRTEPGWVYGFPELPGQREKIAASDRVANPGCHATGFIALIRPLVDAGIIDKSTGLSCFSFTGYSGGGRKMISEYEAESRDPLLRSGRLYGLSQHHKHLPEMKAMTGIERCPVFCPVVVDDFSGMETVIPLFSEEAGGASPEEILSVYEEAYSGPVVRTVADADEKGYLASGRFAGRDDMEISVFGGEGRTVLTARFDNLGKGASGAAVQNMNIMAGFPETESLEI